MPAVRELLSVFIHQVCRGDASGFCPGSVCIGCGHEGDQGRRAVLGWGAQSPRKTRLFPWAGKFARVDKKRRRPAAPSLDIAETTTWKRARGSADTLEGEQEVVHSYHQANCSVAFVTL